MNEPQTIKEYFFWIIPWFFSGLGIVLLSWLTKQIGWSVVKGVFQAKKYRYFIASPLLSMNVSDREEHVKLINEIENALYSISAHGEAFNVLKEIDLKEKDGVADVKIPSSFSVLRRAKYFVGIYHKMALSGAHVEAGFALALSKPSIYFVKNNVKIPSLMEKAAATYGFVKIIRFKNVSEIKGMIVKSGTDLFKFNHDRT